MFKANLIAGILGIALVGAFLGILVGWLKAVPLAVIVVGVMALVIYDVVTSLKESNGSPGA